MIFEARRAACAAAIQHDMDRDLGALDSTLPVNAAMAYASRGGKRLRGFLAMESARLHGISDDIAVGAAVSIEYVHAYSLVHDDLPAMDDDDLRRGQPTVHRKWDDATAILAGDALQTQAFGRLATLELPADRIVLLVATLAAASGARGMVLGQALDIAAETSAVPLDLTAITALQEAKTGALLTWSCAAGPRMAGEDAAALLTYGQRLGLAFQIADDILDVTGDEAKTGKRVGKDADAGKATFVSLLGLDGARSRARDLVAEAEAALDSYGQDATVLRDAARFVISREF